jgi:hypothetical protein
MNKLLILLTMTVSLLNAEWTMSDKLSIYNSQKGKVNENAIFVTVNASEKAFPSMKELTKPNKN